MLATLADIPLFKFLDNVARLLRNLTPYSKRYLMFVIKLSSFLKIETLKYICI